jgi:flavodoxin
MEMNNRQKKICIVIGGAVVSIAILLLWFYRTQTVWIESTPYQRVSNGPAKTLVVVYSRTGNTLGAAKEVARYFDADLLEIDAPQYSRDLKGQQLAGKHADEEVTTTPIKHAPVDLNQYDLIFLCSPTWWFRPAVPLWSFVENHDFEGKQVFLMMTGNSRMKEDRTGKFGALVEEKNGKFMDVLFISRGRVYWQKKPEEVNGEALEALKARMKIWAVEVN